MSFLRALAALYLALPFMLVGANSEVVTHEWGNFTSVAAKDGAPIQWASLVGAPDLPCFVDRSNTRGKFAPALVRMETPVLYFYTPRAVTLSVRVRFPSGLITEWHPPTNKAEPGSPPILELSDGEIEWNPVRVSPVLNPALPSSHGQSRYFAAHNTDSTPLEIGGQAEKFIFYRGVGNFSVPVRPRMTGVPGRSRSAMRGPRLFHSLSLLKTATARSATASPTGSETPWK